MDNYSIWGWGARPGPSNGTRRPAESRVGARLEQDDGISHADGAPDLDGAVERHRAAELPDDPAQHAGILRLRVRIVGGQVSGSQGLRRGPARSDLAAAGVERVGGNTATGRPPGSGRARSPVQPAP
jgi:hypothetical protein